MPKIITEHQSAFTKSRLTFDNILVAFESLHSMQNHSGKDDFMAVKLNMNKAYESGLGIFESSDEEVGVLWLVDQINDVLCYYSHLLNSYKWLI